MSDNILDKNIGELFGFEEMTDEEKAEVLDSIGSIVMESSALRFASDASEDDITSFEHFIEGHAEDDAFLEKLIVEFPAFRKILEEEITAFKTEALEVLGD